MALIKCKDCREDVSSTAKSCPKCGFKVAEDQSAGCLGKGCIFYIVVFFIIFIIYQIGKK